MNIYKRLIGTIQGNYIIMATEKGICWVGKEKEFNQGKKWIHKVVDGANFVEEDDTNLNKAAVEFSQYIKGEKIVFSGPFDMYGTDFQKAVWKDMMKVSYGKTKTYGEVARAIGSPKAVRAVGAACGKNPISIIIPCHRIVGSNGELTGYAGGLKMKEWLITLEQNNVVK